MTARDDFDRHLSAWLAADAPAREPEHLLGQVLARTARTRRRPAWRIPERWIPMSTITSTSATMSRVPLRTLGAVALLILALVVGVVLYAGAQRPELPAPFGLAGNGVILSVAEGDILVRDTIDGDARTLIDVDRPVVGPWPSLDGTRISFIPINPDGTLDVWVANIDGSGSHRVAGPYDDPGSMEWSPSGDILAIGETPKQGDPYVELARTDGGGVTRLDLGMAASLPQWRAPDGAQLLISSWDGIRQRAYWVDPVSGTATPLAIDPRYSAQGPSLSPDGRRLTFYSPVDDAAGPQGGGLQVHVVDLASDGSVVADRILPHRSGDADFDPIFLPDGERILFWRDDGPSTSLHVASAGDLETPVTDLGCCTGRASGRAVTPDGRHVLLFASGADVVRSLDLETKEVADTPFSTEDIVAYQRVAP
jgi:Tol biopolymer transport system component